MARIDPTNLTERLVAHYRSLGLPANGGTSGAEAIAEQVNIEHAAAARKAAPPQKRDEKGRFTA